MTSNPDSTLLRIYNVGLAATITEAFLYGGYLIIFSKCLKVLKIRRPKHVQLSQMFLCFTLLLLFVVASLNLATTLVCRFRSLAPISLVLQQHGQASFRYTGACMSVDVYNWGGVLKSALFVIAILLSDSFLAFRCFMIWGKRYQLMILSAIFLLSDLVLGALYIFDTLMDLVPLRSLDYSESTLAFFYKSLDISFMYCLVVTLALNVIFTSLIGIKIWIAHKRNHKHLEKSNSLSHIIPMIVECGAIYTVWMSITMATYLYARKKSFEDETYHFFQDCIVQVIALVFSMIITRIGQGYNIADQQTPGPITAHRQSGLQATNITLPMSFASPVSSQGTQFGYLNSIGSVLEGDAELGAINYPTVHTADMTLTNKREGNYVQSTSEVYPVEEL